jgi:hypothetical protein
MSCNQVVELPNIRSGEQNARWGEGYKSNVVPQPILGYTLEVAEGSGNTTIRGPPVTF